MKHEKLLIAGWEETGLVTIGKYGTVTNKVWMQNERDTFIRNGIETEVKYRMGNDGIEEVAIFYKRESDIPKMEDKKDVRRRGNAEKKRIVAKCY